MGYRRRKVIRLVFDDDHDLAGLEVELQSVSVREALEIVRLVDNADLAQAELVEQLVARLGKSIIDWNLEDDDGQRIPPSAEALMEQDFGFVIGVARAWTDAVTGVPDPLGQPSSAGVPSQALSIPMQPLSDAPPTSPTPN